MNHVPLDHLLQVTTARPEPFAGSSRPRDPVPAFDNHFRQANAASTASAPATTNSSLPAPATKPAENSVPTPPATASTNSESQQPADDPVVEETSHDEAVSAAPVESAADEDSLKGEVAEEAIDAPDEDSEEDAEVVALLVAVQTAEPVVTDSAPVAPIVADADKAAAVADVKTKSQGPAKPEKPTPRSADAKASAPVETAIAEAVVKAEVVAKTTENRPSAVEQDVAMAATDNTVQTTVRADAKIDATDKSPHSQRKEGEHATPHVDAATAEASTATSNGQVMSAAAAPAVAKPAAAVARGESSDKREKKSSTRSEVPVADAANTPVERPVAVSRAPETAGSPVAANVQAPQASVPVDSAVAPAAATKASNASEGKQGILSSLQRIDRSSHGARGAHRAGEHEATPPHVDPARFISRVSRAVQTAHERGGPLQLRLSPPELGAMRIELSVDQGALTAKVETDTQSAKQILLDNLPALRDRLAEQSIKVERFDVDVRRDSTGSQQQNYAPQDRDQSQRNHAASQRSTARSSSPLVSADEPMPIRRTISSTSINVVA